MAYPVRESVRTFFAEADRRLHVPQHIIHVRVEDAASVVT